MAEEWLLLVIALKCFVFSSCNRGLNIVDSRFKTSVLTVVCFLYLMFLLKLKWTKNKSVSEVICQNSRGTFRKDQFVVSYSCSFSGHRWEGGGGGGGGGGVFLSLSASLLFASVRT